LAIFHVFGNSIVLVIPSATLIGVRTIGFRSWRAPADEKNHHVLGVRVDDRDMAPNIGTVAAR